MLETSEWFGKVKHLLYLLRWGFLSHSWWWRSSHFFLSLPPVHYSVIAKTTKQFAKSLMLYFLVCMLLNNRLHWVYFYNWMECNVEALEQLEMDNMTHDIIKSISSPNNINHHIANTVYITCKIICIASDNTLQLFKTKPEGRHLYCLK